MKLYWKDEEKASLLLCEPAAKVAGIKLIDGKFLFTCLGITEYLQVGTIDEAKALAVVRMRPILLRALEALDRV